ncbi:MAG: Flp family type IVb pilin [Actinocrinis sp.]
MERLLSVNPALQYLLVNLRGRVADVRSGEKDRGASAVEWAVITFIVVAMVVVIGALISNAVRTKGKAVSDCINGVNAANGKKNC